MTPPPNKRQELEATDLSGPSDHHTDTASSASLVVISGGGVGRSHPVDEEIVIGRDPECTIHLRDSSVSRAHVRVHALADGSHELVDLRSSNGTRVNGERVTKARLRHGDRIGVGKTTHFVFLQHNRSEEQVLRMQKLYSLGELAGGIAHDFNNMLCAALASISDVMTDSAMPKELQGTLADGHAAVLRCSELTQQLVAFAASRRSVQNTAVVDSIVVEVCTLLRRTLSAAITLDAAVDPDLIVACDGAKLFQVLLNLCTNARDAMGDSGGVLRIRATPVNIGESDPPDLLAAGDYVCITVQDSGTGMTDLVRQRVFEPFFSHRPASTDTNAGLGMSTAYSIVRAAGGELTVDSKLGVGTLFSAYVPAAVPADRADDDTAPTKARCAPPRPPLSGSLLLVDDEEVLLRALARALRRRGFDVVTAADGIEALKVFEQHRDSISLVLLDLDLPELHGGDVLKAIRRMAPDVPVVVVSGAVEGARKAAAMNDGASCVLTKPFSVATLLEAVGTFGAPPLTNPN
ncbi:MAG: response regulator [Nannocystaceae bacterium]|nr:response regulator [Nannocystaceae bacterium]